MHQAKISEHLLSVNSSQLFNGFQFDNQSIFDEQIDLEGVVQDNAIVSQWNCYLPLGGHPGLAQSLGHQRLVSAFKQTRPKVAMETISAIYRNASDLFDLYQVRHLRVFV